MRVPQTKRLSLTLHAASLSPCALARAYSYRVVGGSSEEWNFELGSDGDMYRCSVGRPRSTYLHFLGFHLTIEGKGLKRVEVFDNDGEALLQEDDYTLEEDTVRMKPGLDKTVNKIVVEA